MTIQLTELINKEKLLNVINCNNIPCNDTDDDPEWILKTQPKILKKLYKSIQDNEKQTLYTQKNEFGRYTTNNGIQRIQKTVRSYICGEYYTDIDFVNCHPVIIEHLFRKHKIYDEFITNYNNNRKRTIKKYNFTNKQDLLKLINNQKLSPKYKNIREISEFHNTLYTLFTKTIYKDDKDTFDDLKRTLKKSGVSFNIIGKILSKYIQNIENDLMLCMKEFFENKGLDVDILMYDGFMVRKNDIITTQFLEDCEQYIYEKMGYNLHITIKSTETDWVPNVIENDTNDEDLNEKYCYKKSAKLLKDAEILDGKTNKRIGFDPDLFSEFMEYMNKFFCHFQYPEIYGFRNSMNDVYRLVNSKKIEHITLSNPINNNVERFYTSSLDIKHYETIEFTPDIDYINTPEIYNTYQRPKYNNCYNNDKFPLFMDFLTNTLCDGNEKALVWVLNWISEMIRKGRTNQAIVLLGNKGTGKSTFGDIIGKLVGDDYYLSLDDIDRVGSNFNSIFEDKILTVVQEIQTGVAEYHKLQAKIKSLITEENIVIEKKGIDSYKTKSSNNYIFISNESNPIKITTDNRRFLPLRINNNRINDIDFFKKLREEINTNIEDIRGFFIHREYDFFTNKHIPTTNCLDDLVDLNKPSIDKFIDNILPDYVNKSPSCRLLKDVYNDYVNYHHYELNEKTKVLTLKYFKADINNKSIYYFKDEKRIDGVKYKNILMSPKVPK
mgnify:CR=1 FL=1